MTAAPDFLVNPGPVATSARTPHRVGAFNHHLNGSGENLMVGNDFPATDGASDLGLTLARQEAAGLRALADFIEANPDLADGFRSTLITNGITVHLYAEDRAAEMARYAKAAARAGAQVTKDIDDTWHNLVLRFGAVKAEVLAYREEVCERVVTGTETVTKTVKDPQALAAVPEVEVTEEVETVEWVCRPLLDTTGPDNAANASTIDTARGAA